MPKVNVARAAKAAAKVEKKQEAPAAPATRRGEARREAILLAAQQIFLEKGYAATSIEDVLERTGGSKATIYAYFGNKEGLIAEVVAARCDAFLASMEIPTKVEGSIERTLTAFGHRVLKIFLDPHRVATLRGLMAEFSRFPELAERFYANGPQRGRAMVAEFLRGQHEAGTIDCPQPEISALQFMEMVKAHAQWRALLGLPPFPPDLDANRVVDAAVATFLKAHAK